jgi:hypothetical protein
MRYQIPYTLIILFVTTGDLKKGELIGTRKVLSWIATWT